jgi:hypothetical protein
MILLVVTFFSSMSWQVQSETPSGRGMVPRISPNAGWLHPGISVSFLENISFYDCPVLTVNPQPAGACSSGLTYCRYPEVDCSPLPPQTHPTQANPLTRYQPTFMMTFECDSEQGACPSSIECATRSLSENVRAAIAANKPRAIIPQGATNSLAKPPSIQGGAR